MVVVGMKLLTSTNFTKSWMTRISSSYCQKRRKIGANSGNAKIRQHPAVNEFPTVEQSWRKQHDNPEGSPDSRWGLPFFCKFKRIRWFILISPSGWHMPELKSYNKRIFSNISSSDKYLRNHAINEIDHIVERWKQSTSKCHMNLSFGLNVLAR